MKDKKRLKGSKPARSEPQRSALKAQSSTPPVPIVGVGASAGGLEAFTRLLKQMPPDTGLGFVLVQHLDPQHESALVQLLARTTSMPVREVTQDLQVEADHVYIIPPNQNLGIAQGRLKLQPRQQTGRPQRVIDGFFESLAQDQRERAIGVILSGTASDGTLGLEAIKAEGGITFAQDESAKYDSMPRSAAAAGCVDFVLSPERMASELARIAKHPYVVGQTGEPLTAKDDRACAEAERGQGQEQRQEREGRPSGEENGFKKLLLLLRQHSGVDFSLYKPTTIQRRITRRMVLNKQEALKHYAEYLRGHAAELDALYSDVLISVTSFFRNSDAFDVLQRMVFPKLLRQRGDDPCRVWVLGCSTGQEAYSIAMAFMEAAERAPRLRKLQIFATDLNDALLDKARHGLYAKHLVQDLSPERLRRFFIEEDGGYRVNKALREMVVFARQNLISDPPFSRMDLISCRNLLIYLEPSLQKKVFPTFHYALKPEGFLLLGASESIGGFTDLFEPVDKKHKLYSKKAAPTPAYQLPTRREQGKRPLIVLDSSSRDPLSMGRGKGVGRMGEGRTGETGTASEIVRGELNAQREADRVTVNQFAPPGVLINADLQVLQFRGPTSAYLAPPTGKASFDVLKMAREGLMLPLRAAINKAKKDNSTARKENVRVQQNGTTRTVHVQVIPLKNVRERCFLILFEDAEQTGHAAAAPSPPQPARTGRPRGAKEESRRVADLETDLADTRDYLQSIQEQHEAGNEELQASNEEVQSANEELQSVNEELETSKEELESANEELTTVNEEMINRNAELTQLNCDLVNLQKSIKLGIVLLGRDLTIRRFSAQAETLFNLKANDVGRPIGNICHDFMFEEDRRDHETGQAVLKMKRPEGHAAEAMEAPSDLEALIADVIVAVREREREVRDKQGRWYSLRVRPYFTLDNKVDGAVLVMVDITDLKRTEQVNASLAEIVNSSDDAIISKDVNGVITSWNHGAEGLFGYTAQEAVGQSIRMLIPPDRLHEEADILARIKRGERIVHFDTVRVRKDRSLVDISLAISPIKDAAGRVVGASKIARNITERKRADETLRASEEKYRLVVEGATGFALIMLDLEGRVTSWNVGAERLLGYRDTEILGQDFSRFFTPEDQAAGKPRRELETAARREEGPDDNWLVRKDGSRFWASGATTALRDEKGSLRAFTKVIRDTTDRKRAAEALAQSHAELQAHAEELARFNSAAVGRELRMIDLKKEINELCERHGEPARYPLDFEEGSESAER